jgi:hypothetical protein
MWSWAHRLFGNSAGAIADEADDLSADEKKGLQGLAKTLIEELRQRKEEGRI